MLKQLQIKLVAGVFLEHNPKPISSFRPCKRIMMILINLEFFASQRELELK
jgi:hypothetical protein